MERTTWRANGAIMSLILPEKGSGCRRVGGIGDGLKATKKKGPSDREGISERPHPRSERAHRSTLVFFKFPRTVFLPRLQGHRTSKDGGGRMKRGEMKE